MFGSFKSLSKGKSERLTLEEKLELLAQFGFRLCAPFKVEDLLESWPREEFEKPGYGMALVGLGMTEERPPWRNHCLNVWHFDTECIEDHGDYVRIAERMKELAEGSLPIINIRDYVDIEEGKASLAFDYEGETVQADLKINDDWVDPGVFDAFIAVLAKSDPSKLFLYYDLDGQDCIIACAQKEALQQMRDSGLAFEPLQGKTIG